MDCRRQASLSTLLSSLQLSSPGLVPFGPGVLTALWLYLPLPQPLASTTSMQVGYIGLTLLKTLPWPPVAPCCLQLKPQPLRGPALGVWPCLLPLQPCLLHAFFLCNPTAVVSHQDLVSPLHLLVYVLPRLTTPFPSPPGSASLLTLSFTFPSPSSCMHAQLLSHVRLFVIP